MDAEVAPERSLEVLSQLEVSRLRDLGEGGLGELFRRCALAVLNSDASTDDAREVFDTYHDFAIELLQQDRGVRIKVTNAPHQSFVDGKMIRGVREHLFAVLRDVLFIHSQVHTGDRFDLEESAGITDAVFHILRHAKILRNDVEPSIAVCWGGHSIAREEYDYCKSVGYELGLRGLDVCTGCGPGAMKGPMKGATIGHAKQRIQEKRYIGITEPGIIAAESPNAIVNELVILPDIEKRLEAFVRCGHGFIVFPGGVGTAEEIFYLLGVLLQPDNAGLPFPLIFTGPESSSEYFHDIDKFLRATLGEDATSKYKIFIDDPAGVAGLISEGIIAVREHRRSQGDAFFFNWRLSIDHEFQMPFLATHENMRKLVLEHAMPKHELAANLRRAFSGIVSGNVKDEGIRLVEKLGPFELCGEPDVVGPLEALLQSFVLQRRMKLPGNEYKPCFRLTRG